MKSTHKYSALNPLSSEPRITIFSVIKSPNPGNMISFVWNSIFLSFPKASSIYHKKLILQTSSSYSLVKIRFHHETSLSQPLYAVFHLVEVCLWKFILALLFPCEFCVLDKIIVLCLPF